MKTSFVWGVALISLGATAQEKPATPALAAAQASVKPENKCSIAGTVVNALTGEPLRKVHLRLGNFDASPAPTLSYGVDTDAAGKYVITGIEPGRYGFSATRNGFVFSAYGSNTRYGFGPMTALTLSPGQVMKDVVFRMMPQAVIAGRVVDEDGDAMAGVHVMAMMSRFRGRTRMYMPGGFGSTDDKGQYRVSGLRPGTYEVAATVLIKEEFADPEIRKDAAANEAYITTYYPGTTTDTNAIPVQLRAGVEVTGIDIELKRRRAVSLRGVITGNWASQHFTIQLWQKSGDTLPVWDIKHNTLPDKNGAFSFHSVSPGTYVVVADLFTEDEKLFTASTTVVVGDANIDNIQLAFTSAVPIPGRIVIDGKEDFADLNGKAIQVGLDPLENTGLHRSTGGQVAPDGTFEIQVASPDHCRLDVSGLPGGYYMRAVKSGNHEFWKETLDLSKGAPPGELTIVVSPKAAQIEGIVRDKDHKPVAGTPVAAIPEQRDYLQRYKTSNADEYGHFVLKGLAPGKYKLFAFDDIEWGAYQDTEFMKPYEDSGEEIEVKEGARETRDLTLIVTDDAK